MSFSWAMSAFSAILLLSSAQDQTRTYTLEDALQICAKVKNPTDRLACFEGLARSASPDAAASAEAENDESVPEAPVIAPAPRMAEPGSDDQPAPDSPVASDDAEQTESRYVIMRAEDYEKEQREAEKRSKPKRAPYDAVVLRAWEYANGEYYIALTNGQIWKSQARDKPRRVEDGEEVRLRPGMVGGWFMQFKTLKRPTTKVKLVE